MKPLTRRATLGLAAVLALGACSSGSGGSSSSSASTSSASSSAMASSSGTASQVSWPLTIKHALGTTTIPSEPKRIVSTSPVLTGTLLALDAPVIGTGASKPGAVGLDDQGQFAHWSAKAKEKHVQVLYKNSELDLEAVMAAKPDLIVVSATGGDSQAKSYAQLSKIAPTIVIDYNTVGWEETTKEVAHALGEDATAEHLLASFDDQLATMKKSMNPPTSPVQAIVFTPGRGSAFAKPNGPHDKIFQALGVPLDRTDLDAVDGGIGGAKRADFTFLSEENTISAIKAKDLLLVGGDEKDVATMKGMNTWAKIPPLNGGRVIPLGLPSFKLDYYSALDMAKHLADAYRK